MQKQKFTIYFFILVILSVLTITGSDCDETTTGENTYEVNGTWQLVEITGYLQDVCPGEIITLSSGNATLQCPNQSAISRTYTYSNNVLTYNTGISYQINMPSSNSLIMSGINVGRTLNYVKMPAMSPNSKVFEQSGKNSSE